MKKLLLNAILLFSGLIVNAQSTCGNRDFEDGTFSNWSGVTGSNMSMPGTPSFTWTPGLVTSGPDAALLDPSNRVCIITQNVIDSVANDPLLTSLRPNGGNYSVRIGNANINFESEGVIYSWTPTATDTLFTFYFAGVYEDPGHMRQEQPGFMVNAYDPLGNLINCATDTIYSADTTFPFITAITAGGNQINYRRWAGHTLCISGSQYIGQAITLEFKNFDCSLGGHFGYTYLDLPCSGTPVTGVYPGDTDYDLAVDFVDFLPLGVAYGTIGSARPSASNSFTYQPMTDWAQSIPLGANYKHIDTNGDGIVDINDTTAILLNYGGTHPYRTMMHDPSVTVANPDLYLVPSSTSVGPNEVISLDVILGSSLQNINSIYGLGFTLDYDANYFIPNGKSTSFGPSWLSAGSTPMLSLAKNNGNGASTDIALVRTNHADVSGNGKIATVNLTTNGNAIPTQLNFNISNLHAVKADGTQFGLNFIGTNVNYSAFVGVKENTQSNFVVYPNPNNGSFTLLMKENSNALVEVIDVLGKVVYSQKLQNTNAINISLENVNKGLYFVRINNEGILSTQKVEVK